ncbi:MAG: glycosyltransferase family 4 protein [Anaerolineales bacterium]
MRIAIITGEYPPMEGGVGDFTHHLSRTLSALGHDLRILTSTVAGSIPPLYRESGARADYLIDDWGWGSYRGITDWLREVEPDIVNIQYQSAAYQLRCGINLYPRWQRKHLSMPVVVTYHDLMPPYIFPKAGPLRKWAVWQLAQYSQGVIVTNDVDYMELTRELEGEAYPPVRLIPIGSNIAPCPPEQYDPAQWRAEKGFAPDDLLIGFFGFLNESKGIETLIEALAQLVHGDEGLPAHLLFIGGRTGSSDVSNRRYAERINALIRERGLEERVDRTGFTSPPQVSAALLAVDLCALPYRDGANLRRGTLHAALAHGNAIVTTEPQIETPQLRDGENVLLVPRQDPDALAEAIRRLWEAPVLRADLGAQAAALAEEFSWDRIAAHTGDFFRKLVEGVA